MNDRSPTGHHTHETTTGARQAAVFNFIEQTRLAGVEPARQEQQQDQPTAQVSQRRQQTA